MLKIIKKFVDTFLIIFFMFTFFNFRNALTLPWKIDRAMVWRMVVTVVSHKMTENKAQLFPAWYWGFVCVGKLLLLENKREQKYPDILQHLLFHEQISQIKLLTRRSSTITLQTWNLNTWNNSFIYSNKIKNSKYLISGYQTLTYQTQSKGDGTQVIDAEGRQRGPFNFFKRNYNIWNSI